MATNFATQPITIPSGTGRRSIEKRYIFGSQVIRAGIAINGFSLDYSKGDHNVNTIEVDTDVISVTENTVRYRVECQLADKNFDDSYSGYITVLIIAELKE